MAKTDEDPAVRLAALDALQQVAPHSHRLQEAVGVPEKLFMPLESKISNGNHMKSV